MSDRMPLFDDPQNDFERFYEALDEVLYEAHHEMKDIRILNKGTHNSRHYYWRFRAPDGTVMTVTIERDGED